MWFDNLFKKINNKKNNNDNKNYVKKDNLENKSNINIGCDLVVDDSDPNRVVIKRYLSLFGRNTDEATNGQEALDKIENGEQLNTYDIIWMDIQMPRMNGIKCTNYLRNELKYTGTIIGLTGHVDAGTISDCEKAGMNAILPKPIEKNVLRAYIDKYKRIE